MAKEFDSPAMPGVKPMPMPPDPRIIPLDRQAALTHQQVEQVRFGLGDTGPLAQAVMNANVPALAKQLATGAVQCLSTRRPADPVVGQMIFETDTQLSLFWSGAAWVNAGSPPVGAAGGDLAGSYPSPAVAQLSNTPIHNSNTTLSFRTSSTERMSIDASGRIRKPFQPVFSAAGATTRSAPNDLSAWGQVPVNVGSGFNATNGRFTAPIAGNYFFTAAGFAETGFPAPTEFVFFINGAGAYVSQYRGYTDRGGYSAVSSISAVFPLAASDYVTCRVNSQGFHGNAATNFTGFLFS